MIPITPAFHPTERGPIDWYNTVLAKYPNVKPTPAGLAHKLIEEATEAALACGMSVRQIKTMVANTIDREFDKAGGSKPRGQWEDAGFSPRDDKIAEECADTVINASIICGLVGLPLFAQVNRKLSLLATRTYHLESTGIVYRVRP